jgi:hypothetical protein
LFGVFFMISFRAITLGSIGAGTDRSGIGGGLC